MRYMQEYILYYRLIGVTGLTLIENIIRVFYQIASTNGNTGRQQPGDRQYIRRRLVRARTTY
jgi:hypothetical protein